MAQQYNLELLCKHRIGLLITGSLLIILGFLAMSTIVFTTFATIMVLGTMLILAGFIQFIQTLTINKTKGFFLHLFVAILNAIAGLFMVTNPTMSLISLTLLLAVLFIAAGAFRVITALSTNVEHRGWLIANGIITFLLGLLIWLQWPSSSLWVVGLFLGIELLLNGWYLVLLALLISKKCHIEHHEK